MDVRIPNAVPAAAVRRCVFVLCAIVPLSGCLATRALHDRIDVHRRGDAPRATTESGHHEPVAIAGPASHELVEVYDDVVPGEKTRSMRVLVDRRDAGVPVLVFTPPAETKAFIYGGARQKAAACVERVAAGAAPALERPLRRELAAYVVLGANEGDVRARGARDIDPVRAFGAEAAVRSAPLCVGLVIASDGTITHALYGPWELDTGAAGTSAGRCRWAAPVPAVDCLAETSIAREVLLKSGYLVTVPFDIVTFPIQLVIGLVRFAAHEWGQ